MFSIDAPDHHATNSRDINDTHHLATIVHVERQDDAAPRAIEIDERPSVRIPDECIAGASQKSPSAFVYRLRKARKWRQGERSSAGPDGAHGYSPVVPHAGNGAAIVD